MHSPGDRTDGISQQTSGRTRPGSVPHQNAIRQGELDIGVLQSDWQQHADHGRDRFRGPGADKALCALFSLHPEPFTVLARPEAGIRGFEDLKGKRVNVGHPGSGQRGTAEVVMRAMGWTMRTPRSPRHCPTFGVGAPVVSSTRTPADASTRCCGRCSRT